MKEKYDREPTDEELASFQLKQKMKEEENAKRKKEIEEQQLQAKRLMEARVSCLGCQRVRVFEMQRSYSCIQEEYERERKREEEEVNKLEEQLGWKEPVRLQATVTSPF